MKKRRLISMILASALLLSACGGTDGNTTQSSKTNKDAVYKEESNVFALEKGEISQLLVEGDTIYVEQYIYDVEKPQARDNEETLEIEEAEEAAQDYILRKITGYSIDGAVKSRFEQKLNINSGAGQFTVDAEGNIYSILYQYATYEGDDTQDKVYLTASETNGTEKWKIQLNEKVEEGEYFYVNSIFCNDKNQILLNSSRGIEIYDNQGNPVNLMKEGSGGETRLFQIRDDKFAVISSDGSVATIQNWDAQSGGVGEKINLPFNYYRYQVYKGGTYDLYLSDEYGIYGYNIGDAEITKIMDYISSDFASGYLNHICFVDENTFVAHYYDDGAVLSKFTKVAPEDVVEKTELILGCYYLDYKVKEKLVEFNKNNQQYRLNIRDYSMYDTMDDYTQGLTRLNTDIVSGDVPDILFLNTQMPFESYVSKGVFADLNDFLEKDTEVKKEDLLPNLLEALSSEDGLYRIAPTFTLTTFIGKTKDVGETPGWTMDEALALLASKPEGTQLLSEITSSSFLYYTTWICGEQYVNWDTGECFFDSEGFIKTLEFAKTLPAEIDYSTVTDDESYWQEMEAQYRNGKTLLSLQYFSSFRDYNYAKQGVFGEDITLIGFPVEEGVGAGLNFGSQIAISAVSKHQDVAWEFVKSFFTPEYQESLEYDLPIRVSALKKLEERAWEKPYQLDENGNKHEYDDYFYVNGMEIPVEPMTPEDTAKFMDYIKSLDKMCIYNETIHNIVTEETAAFFAGQKTAEEVAGIIQSRVKIYVNENS